MRKLAPHRASVHIVDVTERVVTYLDRDDLDPRGVPSLVLPALDAHGAEAEQVHGAVALADTHAVGDTRELALVGVLGVYLGAE